MAYSQSTNNKGFALLLSVIVSSVVLAIGITILSISVNQLKLSSTARESEIAFQAAHAGADCMQYWVNESWDEFVLQSQSSAVPITCFGGSPDSSVYSALSSTINGYGKRYTYQFEWGGSSQKCTDAEAYFLVAESGDYTYTFPNEGVGTNGVKTCSEGNTCTVVISRGYNLPCAELTSSIFAVQRELVVEF